MSIDGFDMFNAFISDPNRGNFCIRYNGSNMRFVKVELAKTIKALYHVMDNSFTDTEGFHPVYEIAPVLCFEGLIVNDRTMYVVDWLYRFINGFPKSENAEVMPIEQLIHRVMNDLAVWVMGKYADSECPVIQAMAKDAKRYAEASFVADVPTYEFVLQFLSESIRESQAVFLYLLNSNHEPSPALPDGMEWQEAALKEVLKRDRKKLIKLVAVSNEVEKILRSFREMEECPLSVFKEMEKSVENEREFVLVDYAGKGKTKTALVYPHNFRFSMDNDYSRVSGISYTDSDKDDKGCSIRKSSIQKIYRKRGNHVLWERHD